MTQENKLVAEFQKNEIELVRLSLTQYKGKDYFGLRLYYREEGEWEPTRKGLCLAIGLLPELKNAIKVLDRAIARLTGS